MKGKISKISVIVLLLLFAFNYAGSNFFSHIHTIDGVKIVHSHPYSHSGHSHSRAAIEMLACNTFTFSAGIATPLLVMILCGVILSAYSKIIIERVCLFVKPRAPPVLN